MNIPDADENPTPCQDKHKVFLTPTICAHEEAKQICATCPFIDWCRSEVKATLELRPNSLEGTWAGVLYTDKRDRRQNSDEVAA